MSKRELQFIDYTKMAYVSEISEKIRDGHKNYYFAPYNEFAKQVEKEVKEKNKDVNFIPYLEGSSENIEEIDNKSSVYVITETDSVFLATFLQKCIRLENIHIVAPTTAKYFKEKPIFVVSIPKSGTHLLRRLIEAFGYKVGGKLNYAPEAGNWYHLEYSNSHTSARDFFIDTVRRTPFGNRDHPFATSPTVMIYRNPLDILVSEANYYHKEGATIFSGYLQQLSFSDRLDRLINDPWLLGTIRGRISNFIAYLDFPNVIPVSFEELVGSVGGGEDQQQHGLIWSLQLKLQIPGDPCLYAKQIYDTESPTFHSGKIGRYLDCFEDKHFSKFNALNQDFMQELGYECIKEKAMNPMPARVQEFRERPLKINDVTFMKTPILIESDYLNFNIVKFNYKYYAIPMSIGELDLSSLTQNNLDAIPQGELLSELKKSLLLGSQYPRLIRAWQRNNLIPTIKNGKRPSVNHPYNIFNRLSQLLGLIFK